jgi:hypothetical protein
MAAAKYVETGRRRWGVVAGAICGAAMGMVVSGLPSFIILPVMVVFAERSWRRRLATFVLAGVSGAVVYAATNPYVIIHLIGDRTVLTSNLGNSTAMYRSPASVDGAINAIWLIGEGASPLIALLGAASAVLALRRRSAAAWLLAAACIAVLVQFALLATNKPGEYGRFAVLPDMGLAIAAACGVSVALRSAIQRRFAFSILLISVIACGAAYEWQFIRDARQPQTRLLAAEKLKSVTADAKTIVVWADPAPYNLPPVNLFEKDIVLAPRGIFPSGGVVVSVNPVDEVPREVPVAERDRVEYLTTPSFISTPISWAGKSFEVIKRDSPAPPVAPRKQGG